MHIVKGFLFLFYLFDYGKKVGIIFYMITTETIYLLDDTVEVDISIQIAITPVEASYEVGSTSGVHFFGYDYDLASYEVTEAKTTDDAGNDVELDSHMKEELDAAVHELDLEALADWQMKKDEI